MNVWDYILIAVIVLAAAGSVAAILIRKKHRGTCCTGCSECSSASVCHAKYGPGGPSGRVSGKTFKKLVK